MENVTLTERVLNRVYKDLAKVLKGKRYDVINFGDWNARVIVRADDFKGWNNGETYSEFVAKMKEHHHDGLYPYSFGNIFSLDYVRGYMGYEDNPIYFAKTEACTNLRNEVLALRDQIDENTPYEVEDRGVHFQEYFWFFTDKRRNPHHMEKGCYICFDVTNDCLEKWRDMEYHNYSQSDECRLEHEMERRAEIQFEDMVCRTHNL